MAYLIYCITLFWKRSKNITQTSAKTFCYWELSIFLFSIWYHSGLRQSCSMYM